MLAGGLGALVEAALPSLSVLSELHVRVMLFGGRDSVCESVALIL